MSKRTKTQFRHNNVKKLVFPAIATSLVGTLPTTQAEIEEIIVTARKKTESLQDASISVQAIAESGLEEQRIDSFSDYVEQLPGVTAGGRGPGQNEIYIRGTAVDAINISVAEAQGSAPNVALYLDEQPVTAGGRNLDVYVADLSRIEVLPGPQGTLYGASSQAGTVRLITNKPILDKFSYGLEGGISTTRGGDPSNYLNATFNVPLIPNRVAIRAVLFGDQQGGYVDNVLNTFLPDPSINPRLPSPEGIEFVPAGGDPQSHQFADGSFAIPGHTYPVKYTPVDNQAFAGENFNDARYEGFRFGVATVLNDDWDLILQHHQQSIDAEGVFDYDPEFGDLKVARYNPDHLSDVFGQTSWTLQGRLQKLDLIYAGAYLNRDVDQLYDYTEYVNIGAYLPGYICEYNTPGYHGGGGVGYTYDPTLSGDPRILECEIGNSYTAINNSSKRWTHEFRIAATLGSRWALTSGVFYQSQRISHIGDFNYLGTSHWPRMDVRGISQNTANSLELRGPSTQFTNDITRPESELAFFGELSFDLNEAVTATLGLRQYFLEAGFEGFTAFRYGSRPVPNLAGLPGVNPNPVAVGGRDYVTNLGDFQPLEVDDLIKRFSVAWDVNDDVLVYGTISEGYRPAGFNRAAAAGRAVAGGVAARGNDGPGGFPDYFIPVIYKSDATNNIEFGWKAIAPSGLLRFNGSVYRIDWKDIQVSHFDSQHISIFTIVDNGGDAEIRGIEFDLEFLPTERWQIQGGFSYNNTELVTVNPAFDFVVADPGSELPLTPKYQLTSRLRYSWEAFNNLAFWQLSARYAGESFNSLVDIPVVDPREVQDAWSVIDLAFGLESQDGWMIEAFIENLTDTRAQLHINRQDHRERVTTNRPRTIGMRVSLKR